MEGVFQWVKNIAYYLIFVSLLSHLMPAGKYEQYVKLFSGAVFILLVVSPLTKGLHLEGQLAHAFEQIRFTQEQEEFQQKVWGIEEQRMERIMDQYEQAVSLDIRAMAEEEGFVCVLAEARIEGREEEENFGQVVEVALVLGKEREIQEEIDQSVKGIIGESGEEYKEEKAVSIEKVQIVVGQEKKEQWDEEQRRNGQEKWEAVNKFRRKVANNYGLEEEAVQITWKDD